MGLLRLDMMRRQSLCNCMCSWLMTLLVQDRGVVNGTSGSELMDCVINQTFKKSHVVSTFLLPYRCSHVAQGICSREWMGFQ